MLVIDLPLTGGMGYAVLGGAEITGVLVFGSLLLQATVAINVTAARKHKISDLFVAVILDWVSFILFVGEWFTRDAVLTFNPPAKIDKLAALSTEGTKGVVFPLGRLTAGWAFHEFEPRTAHVYSDAGRLISIRRLTNAIVPARRMAFKRTVTLSRVEPTMEAISRWGRGMSMRTPSGSDTP